MLYLLPTRGTTRYTGKRPLAIRSMSTSPRTFDKDGRRCMHLETNNGSRFTTTFDLLDLPNYAGVVGKLMSDILKVTAIINVMSDEEYNAWRTAQHQARLEAAKTGE